MSPNYAANGLVEDARPATEDDDDAVAALVDASTAEQLEARGGAVFFDREGIPSDTASEVTFVGTLDDVVVGYATVSVEDLETAGRLGRVRGLFVLPDARGVGVGEVMMDQVVRWCREQGCSGIDGYALPGNRATKNFFETFGFTARLLTVHRRLDD